MSNAIEETVITAELTSPLVAADNVFTQSIVSRMYSLEEIVYGRLKAWSNYESGSFSHAKYSNGAQAYLIDDVDTFNVETNKGKTLTISSKLLCITATVFACSVLSSAVYTRIQGLKKANSVSKHVIRKLEKEMQFIAENYHLMREVLYQEMPDTKSNREISFFIFKLLD